VKRAPPWVIFAPTSGLKGLHKSARIVEKCSFFAAWIIFIFLREAFQPPSRNEADEDDDEEEDVSAYTPPSSRN
jgi:hypothetical protein